MEQKGKPDDISSVKDRLREGKLTDDDVRTLEDLLTQAEEATRLKDSASETIGERKIIARLPHGMDIVK